MSGITIYPNAFVQPDGTLQVNGTFEGTSGDTDTVTAAATEGVLTIGSSLGQYPATGSFQSWTLYLAPIGNSWAYGSAVCVAVLLNPSGAQIGYATQELTVSAP
jgi:hypothetical protein